MQKMLFSKLLTAPSFKLPPIWMIKSTCPGQFIALNPIDADGDKIKCRWATETEADSAFYIESVWPSLSLDQDNCIVHYDGIFDPFGQKNDIRKITKPPKLFFLSAESCY